MFINVSNKYDNTPWVEFGKEVNGFHEYGLHTKHGRITYKSGPWVIVLDTYSRQNPATRQHLSSCAALYTRIRALFE